MAQPSFRDILSNIKSNKQLSPVYLLFGEEAFYIDQLVEAFENHVIPAEDKDFNLNVFYGNDADMEGVIACAQQFPVMADRKLVILKEAQSANQAKSQIDKLAPYIKRPNTTTVFVVAFKGESPAQSSKIMKAAAESGAVVFKSQPIKDWQLPGHVKDYCASLGLTIEEKATVLLCEYIGNPLSKLFGEINKLAQIKGKDKRITADDIEKNIGISKDYNSFELSNAVAIKDYPKAMRILKYFRKNPKSNPAIQVNAVLFNFFQKLVICHYLPEKSDKAIMEALALKNSYSLKDIKAGLSSYNPYQAVMAIHHTRELDTKSKGIGSYQNEYDLLAEMLFKIFTS